MLLLIRIWQTGQSQDFPHQQVEISDLEFYYSSCGWQSECMGSDMSQNSIYATIISPGSQINLPTADLTKKTTQKKSNFEALSDAFDGGF